jgi:DNA polymerase III sliding clamp (beta) subunit (PCNA family)
MKVQQSSFEKILRVLLRSTKQDNQFIPILACVCFSDGLVCAYNDIQLLSMPLSVDFDPCAVPADTLHKVVASFDADATIQITLDDNALVVKSGRSRVAIPVLPSTEFVHDAFLHSAITQLDAADVKIKKPSDLLESFESVLFSVGNQTYRPAASAISVYPQTGTVWSTDNVSITKFKLDRFVFGKNQSEDSYRVPPMFVTTARQALAFSPDSNIQLVFGDSDIVVLQCGEILVASKLVYDASPPDFDNVFDSVSKLSEATIELPQTMVKTIDRAQVLLGGANDKRVELQFGPSSLIVVANGLNGALSEPVKYVSGSCGASSLHVTVDPDLLLRALSRGLFTVQVSAKALLFTDPELPLEHVIANMVSK